MAGSVFYLYLPVIFYIIISLRLHGANATMRYGLFLCIY